MDSFLGLNTTTDEWSYRKTVDPFPCPEKGGYIISELRGSQVSI